MKTIKVRFANGKVIDAPAVGKVLQRDLRLSPAQLDELYEKNVENMKLPKHIDTVNFNKIKELEAENKAYYESLPKWFNYNRKGEIVNEFKTFKEFAKATFKKKRR